MRMLDLRMERRRNILQKINHHRGRKPDPEQRSSCEGKEGRGRMRKVEEENCVGANFDYDSVTMVPSPLSFKYPMDPSQVAR